MIRVAFVFALTIPVAVWAQGKDSSLNFNAAMREFFSSPAYVSTTQEIRAIDLDFDSRDLVLEPQFELGAHRYRDHV